MRIQSLFCVFAISGLLSNIMLLLPLLSVLIFFPVFSTKLKDDAGISFVPSVHLVSLFSSIDACQEHKFDATTLHWKVPFSRHPLQNVQCGQRWKPVRISSKTVAGEVAGVSGRLNSRSFTANVFPFKGDY